MSKSQQRKFAKFEPQPPPPKPIIPKGIQILGSEENWLDLWDLPDVEIERRVLRARKRKAASRKALRAKQQSGKYTWKSIKEEEKRHKTKIKSAEDEEGVAEIKPKALGMRGLEVDFDSLELVGSLSDVKSRGQSDPINRNKRRVDLSGAAGMESAHIMPTGVRNDGDPGDFIKLDLSEGQDHEALNYNHKLRRKLRRAIETADIKKESLVRERAAERCQAIGMDPLPELVTPAKPIHLRGERVLEDGTLETAKAERVRLGLELAEFNKAARVLRAQAKELAM
ncbi:hypothetical protein MMC26_007716 [Xylographa opegraphella]|nr:hypothetical protein [Xylographa opegraphella]